MSVICRHAVLLAAVTVVIGACSYRAGDTCDGDVCVNHAPIAVISDVGGDGALRVGGAGEVLVSAHESTDPDGDALAFAWTVSTPCDVAVVSDLTSQELRLDNLAIGSTCEVALTVSDGRGLSASATATLVVRNVGGYVTVDALQCVATFDPDSDAPQGTPETPFCTVQQGLIAAKTFHLAEVSLETGVHGLPVSEPIDFPVRITGGYTRAAGDWPRIAGASSVVELRQPLFAGANTEIMVSGGVTLELRALTVRRFGVCGSNCALVRVNRASLELQSTTLGSSSVLSVDTANDAPGVTYASVQLDAVDDTTHHLRAEGVTIFGSANAAVSYGILVNGPVEVTLSGLTVHERAFVSAGVRTTNAGAVSITGSTFDIQPESDAGSQGYAILDGDRQGVSISACVANTASCRASRSLSVDDSTIVVSGADEVFGIDALGTAELSVTGTSVTVDGQQAWGVLTSNLGSGTIDQTIIDATTRRFRDPIQAFAAGISDNLDDSNARDAGSQQLTVSRSQIDVHIVGNEIDEAAGVNLVQTSNVTLDRNTLRVTGTSHLSSVLQNVAGVRLLTAHDVSILDGSIEVSGLRAEVGVAGIADGDVIVGGLPTRVGSDHVTVSGVDILTAVQGDLLATAACVVLVGTETARIIGGRSDAAMTCGASGPGTSFGIFTSSGTDVEIRGVSLLVQSAPAIAGLNDSTLVGIHDGGILVGELDYASTNLVVTGNRIRLDQVNRKAIGVRVRGGADAEPVIDDNFIGINGSFKNIGVLLQSTRATVALNSIRLAGCDGACAAPYAVGVYVMHSQAFDNKLLGNAISVYGLLDAVDRPAIVRHSSVPGEVAPSVGTVNGNLFGSESGGSEAAFVSAIGDATTNVLAPSGMTAYAMVDVPGLGNVAGAPSYCPDGIHGDPAGAQRGVAEVIAQTFGADIDGEVREVANLEAGADRVAATCP